MNYCHTQKAPLFLILLGTAAVFAVVAGCLPAQSRDQAGLLVVAKGQEITATLLLKIMSLLGTGSIAGEVAVSGATAPSPAAVDNLAQ